MSDDKPKPTIGGAIICTIGGAFIGAFIGAFFGYETGRSDPLAGLFFGACVGVIVGVIVGWVLGAFFGKSIVGYIVHEVNIPPRTVIVVALAVLLGGAIVGAIQNKHGSASALIGAVLGLGWAVSMVAVFAIMGAVALFGVALLLVGGMWISEKLGMGMALFGAVVGAILGWVGCFFLLVIVLIVGTTTGWFGPDDRSEWNNIGFQVSQVGAILGAIVGAIIGKSHRW